MSAEAFSIQTRGISPIFGPLIGRDPCRRSGTFGAKVSTHDHRQGDFLRPKVFSLEKTSPRSLRGFSPEVSRGVFHNALKFQYLWLKPFWRTERLRWKGYRA